MLDLQDVTVRFGGVTPLDGVNLTFTDQVCGLIGPNGAGKTTLLNVLSGFVKPITGRVQTNGSNLLTMAPHRRARWGVRRTFQTEQLIAHLSVHDNVLIAAENISRHTGRVHSVGKALDFVGLADKAGIAARTLTSFERKRLELARALVGRPRVILLDEPAAGISGDETAPLATMISTLFERFGAQVVLIDHDVSLVRSVCTSLAVLDFGRVIATGATETVLADETVQRAYLGAEDL